MSFSLLTPKITVNSVASINLSRLAQHGIKGLLLDYDNTLLPWSDTTVQARVINWVRRAKRMGFKLCIVSNAQKERLHEQSQALGIPYVPKALKPTCIGINRALELLELEPQQVAMVGDQMFTDILAGNRAGVATVLVKPLLLREQWWMKAVRFLEDCLQFFVLPRPVYEKSTRYPLP